MRPRDQRCLARAHEASQSGFVNLIGVGPGLCELPRITIPRTSVNKGKKKGGVRLDWSNAAGRGLWLLED